MKVIKAIYNFIVGDMVILVDVMLAVIILTLINNVPALAPFRLFWSVPDHSRSSQSCRHTEPGGIFLPTLAMRENGGEVHIWPIQQRR